jgi:HlyD family type I secretion membrane fusion protein
MTEIAARDARQALIDELTGTAAGTRQVWRWVLSAMFVTGIFLIAFVPISSGVSAPGLLHPATPRQTIQHPTGGVVKTILVKDGQTVDSGQVLVALDDAQERAAFSAARFQVVSLRAELAVRQAEVQGLAAPSFPSDLTALAASDSDVRDIVTSQTAAFEARSQSNANQTSQIKQQVLKNTQAAAQARAREIAARRQLALVREEWSAMKTLLDKGLTLKSRVLALERAQANLTGEATALSAEVQRLTAENAELTKRTQQPELTARVQASDAMRSVAGDLAAAQDRYLAARAALDRTVLRAPLAGKVLSSRVMTIGGVIRPGEPVMEIVPDDTDYLVKARIRLADSDNVKAGQDVAIRFDMAQGTSAPTITGTVASVSADAIEDPRTGESYFEARITIPLPEASRVSKDVLAPGRPAEVLIKTGERTLLSYFLSPLERAQFKALREE